MKLLDYFERDVLTGDQRKALDRLEAFLDSDVPIFILKGSAGTGKTFIVSGLVRYLKERDQGYVLAAPTGRAARILSDRAKSRAYTIHQLIYSSTDLREYRGWDKEDEDISFRFYFELKPNVYKSGTVFIVDEASMVSDRSSDSEFLMFGSGRLLSDFLSFVDWGHLRRQKIVFIGDWAQLPPVGMNFSPALDGSYLRQTYGIESEEFELTEVVRHREGGILENATMLREALRKDSYVELCIKVNKRDVINLDSDSFPDTYKKIADGEPGFNVMVVARSNEEVKEYNDLVREYIFGYGREVRVGDHVVVVRNNYSGDVVLLNGEFGVVRDVDDDVEERRVKLKRKTGNAIEEKEVVLRFRRLEIMFGYDRGEPLLVERMIIENLLYSQYPDLTSDEKKALYVDFWIRHPGLAKIRRIAYRRTFRNKDVEELLGTIESTGVEGDVAYKLDEAKEEYFSKGQGGKLRKLSLAMLRNAIKGDEYFNALCVKFGYAVTCHKAQGGEWENVFVDCRVKREHLSRDYFRWLYTSITRAKNKLYFIGNPNFRVGDGIEFVRDVSRKSNVEKFRADTARETFSQCEEGGVPFPDFPEDSFLLNLYYQVRELVRSLDAGINIKKVEHKNYNEIYTFSRGNYDFVKLSIYYNNKGKVSRVVPSKSSNDELKLKIVNVLRVLEGRPLGAGKLSGGVKNLEFPESKPFLRKFYERLIKVLEGSGINISDIVHRDFMETYVFEKGGKLAIVNFYYNKKGRFTKCLPDYNRTTSEDLLDFLLCKIESEFKR